MGITAAAGNVISSGIGALGSGIGTFLNAVNAKANTDRQNKANREMAEYQYSKDLEMWNKGNAYNDPSAQMDRLKRAGLNPNLVYGQGAVGNTAGQLPKYQAPTISYNYRPPVDPLQMIGAYQDFRLRQAEIKKSEAEAANAELFYRERAKEMDWKSDERWATKDIKGVIRDMMTGEFNNRWADTGKPTDKPTDWQRYSLDFLKNQAKAMGENALNAATLGKGFGLQNDLKSMDVELYKANWWTKLIFGGMRALK